MPTELNYNVELCTLLNGGNYAEAVEFIKTKDIDPLAMTIVTYEIAKKLKAKGFYDFHIPTIAEVLEWLRREKNIYVSIFIDDDSDCPVTYEIYKGTECVRTHHGEYFALKDWNQCETRAIQYAFDNLI